MKKLIVFALAVLMLINGVTAAFAADGSVTYSGDAGKFIFAPGSDDSPTDLFPNFKDVMPGDTLTQRITVKNDASNKVKVKIYMRALGAHPDSEKFLSQLGLMVQKSGDSPLDYLFAAAASEKAQLSDWVCLGTLYSGGKVDLNVTLAVPVELDNAFSSQIGYLDWEFKVEEFPVEDTDPEPPKTGDDFSILLWGTVMAASAAAILILLLIGRKKEKQA